MATFNELNTDHDVMLAGVRFYVMGAAHPSDTDGQPAMHLLDAKTEMHELFAMECSGLIREWRNGGLQPMTKPGHGSVAYTLRDVALVPHRRILGNRQQRPQRSNDVAGLRFAV